MTDDAAAATTSNMNEQTVHNSLISGREWYYVLGEWSCLECGNEWTHKRTKIRLSKYKDGIDADSLQNNDRVKQRCRKCDSKNSKLVKYSSLQPEDIKPLVCEHLIVEFKEDKWYRVYGTWKCDRKDCKKSWASAHTYILLSKYLAKVPATELVRGEDYWGQDCTSTSRDQGTLIDYRHLMLGRSVNSNDPNHKSGHCHKCNANFPCT